MLYKIEIQEKPGMFDVVGEGVKKDILDLGITGVTHVAFSHVYTLDGDLTQDQLHRLCGDLFADPVAQGFRILTADDRCAEARTGQSAMVGCCAEARTGQSAMAGCCAGDRGVRVVEVAYNPGVMDPSEESVLKGIRDMGIDTVRSVKTARTYRITGSLSDTQFKTIAEKLLYNKLIQHLVDNKTAQSQSHPSAEAEYRFNLVTVDLLGASDKKLLEISSQGQLFLNINEMKAIKRYFVQLGRNPTDCELETIAQTWSEHCWHKTFRGRIEYREFTMSQGRKVMREKKIDNLLKSTIMKVTRELKKPWCVSVFNDNSGVIRFDEKYNVCFKVETHNHPSALEPFGGANTGVGGVIRDPMGTGLGAKPILNTDVFCFAPPDYPFDELPPGTLHPKRVMKGVVSGVRDYGNKMGIPTVNGAILFHEGFVGNPLVYCGTVGILPKEKSFKKTYSGDAIVVLGGRTGRDGIHGATFSSGELTHESETVSSGAVQIGNPIQEKKMLDAMLKARDEGLYTAVTDCGAGGLSSAVGEMGAQLGARVDLDKVPLKYTGLSYMEIWISESQERMVLSVPDEKVERLIEVFDGENVEATVIGEFTGTGKLELFYKGREVCSLDMGFLHEGLPKIAKKAVYMQGKIREPDFACPKDLTPSLMKLLGHNDIASKEWVIRQYDHEVQGGSVLKPLVGIENDGPSDASIVRPVLDSNRGVIVSNGINFRYGFIDPYWMAVSCIDEALRQVISVGGDLKVCAILDNFCWGNPDKPDRLGGLVRCAYGCYDAAKGFGVPFISGKDSLYNEFTVHNTSIAIPGTLLISAIAVMEDISKAVTMYAKQPGDLVYIVGRTSGELGGSHYYDLAGHIGNTVPRVNMKKALAAFNALSAASKKGLVRAMHDCSDGGLAVAAAEMAFSGGLGMELFTAEVPYKPLVSEQRPASGNRNDFVLFSESNSRFVVEVGKDKQKEFEKILLAGDVTFGLIGCLKEEKEFRVFGIDGEICINARSDELKEAWQKPLRW